MKDLVEKYIKLRDAKDKLRQKHKAEVAQIDNLLERIEASLLADFKKEGIESVRTECGTAYRTTRTSAGVADWDAVLSYIQANGLWSMLERRVSKEAVAQFREEHDELPPGVNWREEVVVNVRRSA
jgi:putative component of toxin-antitoxin plasmid stabilization module